MFFSDDCFVRFPSVVIVFIIQTPSQEYNQIHGTSYCRIKKKWSPALKIMILRSPLCLFSKIVFSFPNICVKEEYDLYSHVALGKIV